MNLDLLIKKINNFAGISLQEKWDNSGIQVIISNSNIDKALLTLDITKDCIDYAIKNNFNLIISHHPFIFSGLKSINYKNFHGSIIIKAIQNNINIISLHTNIDKSLNGLADFFCKKLNLVDIKPLSSKKYKSLFKIVTFLPEDFLNKFLDFFHGENISVFSGYKSCSFYSKGKGTFYPLEDSNPAYGSIETLNNIPEIRIEITVNDTDVDSFVQKIKNIHPYEMPVVDVYSLNLNGDLLGALGRVGRFIESVTFSELIELLKNIFKISVVKYVANDIYKKINKIAVCPGSGMSLVSDVKKTGVDVYITGDVKYHEALEFAETGIGLIDIGHFGSEFIFTELLKDFLENSCGITGHIFPQKDIFKYK